MCSSFTFGYDQLNSIKQAIEFGFKHHAARRPGAAVHPTPRQWGAYDR
jgi:hypothetical protein